MTVDDLIAAYIEARNAVEWGAEKRGLLPLTNDMSRAGVRAVVVALRDEIWTRIGCVEANDIINEILGSRAGEKVAGGSSRDASKATEASGARCATPCASAPATDPIRDAVAMARGRVLVVDDIPMLNKLAAAMKPASEAAPAVCVWTGEEYVTYSTSCESEHEVDPHKAPPTHCPSCGKPIRFRE